MGGRSPDRAPPRGTVASRAPSQRQEGHDPRLVAIPTALVAEDHPDLLRLLEIQLGREGFEVITAPDGRVALDLIDQAAPDVVVTDLQMPGLDGLELIRRLRANERWRAVPVLVFTAYSGNDARLLAAAVMPHVTVHTKGESVRGLGALLRSLIERAREVDEAGAADERDRRRGLETAMVLIGDASRRLPGEVDGASGDEARRWYQTYQDLLRCKLETIATILQHRDEVDPAGHPEVELDLLVLEAEKQRLEERLAYWRERGEAGDGGGAQAPAAPGSPSAPDPTSPA